MVARTVTLLAVVVDLVLLIAYASIGNLLLTRGVARRRGYRSAGKAVHVAVDFQFGRERHTVFGFDTERSVFSALPVDVTE